MDRQCITCGAPFKAAPSAIARGDGKYCSRPCVYEGLRGQDNYTTRRRRQGKR